MRKYQVEEFLRQFRNKNVLYFPNSGNAGDSLISAASMQCMRRAGVHFEPITLESNVDKQVVILGGGGNLVPMYETIQRALENFKDRAQEIVLLPHTIRGNEELLTSLPANCTLFCRDVPSYEHVLSLGVRAEKVLAHDMAFHLDVDELMDDDHRDEYQSMFRSKLDDLKIYLHAQPIVGEAYYVRRDGESAGVLTRCDVDISSLFEFGVWPGHAERASWCFIEAIRIVEKVVTDRLHVALASALLEKPCVLYDNSYHKNREVFRHSLQGWSTVSFAS
jgi:exopolysaccharide biosynthesis predicted pyruvyltransferase EpsI